MNPAKEGFEALIQCVRDILDAQDQRNRIHGVEELQSLRDGYPRQGVIAVAGAELERTVAEPRRLFARGLVTGAGALDHVAQDRGNRVADLRARLRGGGGAAAAHMRFSPYAGTSRFFRKFYRAQSISCRACRVLRWSLIGFDRIKTGL